MKNKTIHLLKYLKKIIFKIVFKIYSNNINDLKDYNIFVLQYPNNSNNEISFSFGKIKFIENNKIIYNASTTYGSSCSLIILRNNDNLLIGIHHIGNFYKSDNMGTIFNSILFDIQKKILKHIKPRLSQ